MFFLILSCGAGGGGGPKPQPTTTPGPFLKFASEGSDAFSIDILSVTEAPEDYLPDEMNEAEIDLGGYDLVDGIYEVEIFGENLYGSSKKIKFDLEVSTVKGIRTWEIVPIQALIDSDPDYISSFEQGSLIIQTKYNQGKK
jgi:hypothetical protein